MARRRSSSTVSRYPSSSLRAHERPVRFRPEGSRPEGGFWTDHPSIIEHRFAWHNLFCRLVPRESRSGIASGRAPDQASPREPGTRSKGSDSTPGRLWPFAVPPVGPGDEPTSSGPVTRATTGSRAGPPGALACGVSWRNRRPVRRPCCKAPNRVRSACKAVQIRYDIPAHGGSHPVAFLPADDLRIRIHPSRGPAVEPGHTAIPIFDVRRWSREWNGVWCRIPRSFVRRPDPYLRVAMPRRW